MLEAGQAISPRVEVTSSHFTEGKTGAHRGEGPDAVRGHPNCCRVLCTSKAPPELLHYSPEPCSHSGPCWPFGSLHLPPRRSPGAAGGHGSEEGWQGPGSGIRGQDSCLATVGAVWLEADAWAVVAGAAPDSPRTLQTQAEAVSHSHGLGCLKFLTLRRISKGLWPFWNRIW